MLGKVIDTFLSPVVGIVPYCTVKASHLGICFPISLISLPTVNELCRVFSNRVWHVVMTGNHGQRQIIACFPLGTSEAYVANNL